MELLWCPVPGQEAVGTKWNTGCLVWIPGSTFFLCGLMKQWHRLPKEDFQLGDFQSCLDVALGSLLWVSLLVQMVEPDYLQRSLPTLAILWFRDSFGLKPSKTFCSAVGRLSAGLVLPKAANCCRQQNCLLPAFCYVRGWWQRLRERSRCAGWLKSTLVYGHSLQQQ